MITGTPLHGDEPIDSRAADVLGRAHFADLVKDEVLRSPATRGFVISVTGRWGSGKTSVLKLVEEAMGDDAVALWFNPWLFSSSDQLVSRFFAEVAAQLEGHQDEDVRKLAGQVASYGKALAPLVQLVVPGVGTAMSVAAEAVRGTAGAGGVSTWDRYVALAGELAGASKRLVVFIDDIDRLQSHEVAEVMRLVKLVGDLPNVVYVLAYDRERVERALGDDEVKEGRAYIEKIVQVAHTLPAIRPATLQRIAQEELNAALGERDLPFFDDNAWAGLFRRGIAPMIVTLRDARRFANVAPLMVDLVADEVAGQDLLALEALRVFEPDVHSALPQLAPILTGVEPTFGNRQQMDNERRATITDALARAQNKDAATALLQLLFPAAGHLFDGVREQASQRSWRLARRAASPDVLDVYLHATFGEEGIATSNVVKIVAALNDPQQLRELLADVDDEHLDDLLDRVPDYGEDFTADEAAGAGAFLDLFPRLSIGPGWSRFPPEWALAGVLRLLLRAVAPDDRGDFIEGLFENAPSLTARWHVLAWFGHSDEPQEQDESRALTPEATEAMRERLREQIVESDVAALSTEPRLLTLLGMVVRGEEDEESRRVLRKKLEDDELFLALLVNCMQYSDWWPSLLRLVGADALKARLAAAEDTRRAGDLDEEAAAAVERAARRAGGETDPMGLD